MKLFVISAAMLLPASASPDPASTPQADPASTVRHLPAPAIPDLMARMPNAYTQGGATCLPIIQQVQDEAKPFRNDEHRTLDREPPAHLLLAVDRHVAGCREVTFIRRNAAPAAQTFEPAAR